MIIIYTGTPLCYHCPNWPGRKRRRGGKKHTHTNGSNIYSQCYTSHIIGLKAQNLLSRIHFAADYLKAGSSLQTTRAAVLFITLHQNTLPDCSNCSHIGFLHLIRNIQPYQPRRDEMVNTLRTKDNPRFPTMSTPALTTKAGVALLYI